MKEYFKYRETSNNGFTIVPVYDLFGPPCIKGSFGLFPCRFLGISWTDWLRLCRQNGATLYGKGALYISAVWKEPNKDFLKIINERTAEIAKRIDITKLNY